jgi:chromosome segregation ATPase
VKLGPSATETFAVHEERVYDQTMSITSMTPAVIATWSQNKALSDAGRRQLEQIAQKKREIADNDAAISQAESDITARTQDQTRIRSNIQSLNNVSGQQEQVQQYARQLSAAESKLVTLRDTQSELRRKKATLESELNSLMEKADF